MKQSKEIKENMKRKIKLRDLSKEQWDENKGIECNKCKCCNNCKFGYINCDTSNIKSSWINHKEMYSDKFLDQEIEIEVPNILTKEEKEYLSNIIKPFKDKVTSIKKIPAFGSNYRATYCILITINSQFSIFGYENIELPYFQKDMYQGMEINRDYILEELGL